MAVAAASRSCFWLRGQDRELARRSISIPKRKEFGGGPLNFALLQHLGKGGTIASSTTKGAAL